MTKIPTEIFVDIHPPWAHCSSGCRSTSSPSRKKSASKESGKKKHSKKWFRNSPRAPLIAAADGGAVGSPGAAGAAAAKASPSSARSDSTSGLGPPTATSGTSRSSRSANDTSEKRKLSGKAEGRGGCQSSSSSSLSLRRKALSPLSASKKLFIGGCVSDRTKEDHYHCHIGDTNTPAATVSHKDEEGGCDKFPPVETDARSVSTQRLTEDKNEEEETQTIMTCPTTPASSVPPITPCSSKTMFTSSDSCGNTTQLRYRKALSFENQEEAAAAAAGSSPALTEESQDKMKLNDEEGSEKKKNDLQGKEGDESIDFLSPQQEEGSVSSPPSTFRDNEHDAEAEDYCNDIFHDNLQEVPTSPLPPPPSLPTSPTSARSAGNGDNKDTFFDSRLFFETDAETTTFQPTSPKPLNLYSRFQLISLSGERSNDMIMSTPPQPPSLPTSPIGTMEEEEQGGGDGVEGGTNDETSTVTMTTAPSLDKLFEDEDKEDSVPSSPQTPASYCALLDTSLEHSDMKNDDDDGGDEYHEDGNVSDETTKTGIRSRHSSHNKGGAKVKSVTKKRNKKLVTNSKNLVRPHITKSLLGKSTSSDCRKHKRTLSSSSARSLPTPLSSRSSEYKPITNHDDIIDVMSLWTSPTSRHQCQIDQSDWDGIDNDNRLYCSPAVGTGSMCGGSSKNKIFRCKRIKESGDCTFVTKALVQCNDQGGNAVDQEDSTGSNTGYSYDENNDMFSLIDKSDAGSVLSVSFDDSSISTGSNKKKSLHDKNKKKEERASSGGSSLTKYLDWNRKHKNRSSDDHGGVDGGTASVGHRSAQTAPAAIVAAATAAEIGCITGADGREDDIDNKSTGVHSVGALSQYARGDGNRRSKVEVINDLKTKNIKLRQEMKLLKEKMNEKDQTIEDVVQRGSERVHSLEAQMRDTTVGLQALLKKHEGDMDGREKAVKALAHVVKMLNDRHRDKAVKYAETRAELEKLRVLVDELEDERSRLHGEMMGMTCELRSNATEIEGLQRELTESMHRTEKLRVERQEDEEKISLLQEQLVDSHEKIAWMQDESWAKTEQIERFEDELLEKNEVIDKLRKDLDEKCKRMIDLQVELEASAGRLKGMEEVHRKEIEELERKYAKEIEELNAAAALQTAKMQKKNRKGIHRLLPGKKWQRGNGVGGASSTTPTEKTSGDDDYEMLLAERDTTIDELERAIRLNEETITKLRSELVHLNTKYKDDRYKNSVQIEKLTQENAAYAIKVEVLEKEFQQVNVDNNSVTAEVKSEREKVLRRDAETGADEAAGKHKPPSSDEASPTREDAKKTSELEKRIQELEKEKAWFQSTIETLNSDMIRFRMMSKDENFRGKLALEQLRQENAAKSIKVAALEKEFQYVNGAPEEDEKEEDNVSAKSQANSEESENKNRFKWRRSGPQDEKIVVREGAGTKDKDAKIVQLEKACEMHEQTVSSLRSELIKLRMELKSQAYRSQQELEGLQKENTANSIKVEVLERKFQEVNSVQQEKEESHDGKADNTSRGIVSLDASYLAELKSQLAKKEERIKALEEEIFSHRAIATRMEEDFTREIEVLKADKAGFYCKASDHSSIGNIEDEIFLTEEDLLDILQPTYASIPSSPSESSYHSNRCNSGGTVSAFGLEPVQEEIGDSEVFDDSREEIDI